MQSNVHERVWERSAAPPPWRPLATYGLLGTMLVVYILELATVSDPARFESLWLVTTDWPSRPWTPITSTFAHDGPGHLLLNGLMLFFFGPLLERMLGRRRFVVLFIVSGAVSGIIQVHLSEALQGGQAAGLGASGAIMMVFGALAAVMPTQKILLMGIVPIPFWVAAVGYAAYDIVGELILTDNVGHIAHLAGMAIGLVVGLRLRDQRKQRMAGFGGAGGVQYR